MLPNFLIVGAMKAGTTTLRDYLKASDQVWIYPAEVRFFSRDDVYARGLDWYESLFASATGQAIGEKSPAYSFQPKVPGRIHACLPQVKLVWIFREPVARAYSHYWHAATRGKEHLSFRDAIEREPRRIARNLLRGYARRSLYAEQVKRYLEYFPRQQMLFLLFEDLVRNPPAALNQVLAFLDVDTRVAHLETPNHSNVTRAPRSVRLQWLARTMFDDGKGFEIVKRFNVRREAGYPKIPLDLRRRLADAFQRPNEELAALTGLDLAPWRRSA